MNHFLENIQALNWKKCFQRFFLVKVEKKLVGNCYLPLLVFLWTSTILCFYQVSEKLPASIKFWNIIDCGVMIDWALSFITLIHASSCPRALLMPRLLIIFNISLLVKLITQSLTSESYSRKVATTLIS